MTLSAQDRARRIKIILFDVDGVLTDGGIWMFPAPANSGTSLRNQLAEKDGQAGFGIQSTTMVGPKASTRTMARLSRWRGWVE